VLPLQCHECMFMSVSCVQLEVWAEVTTNPKDSIWIQTQLLPHVHMHEWYFMESHVFMEFHEVSWYLWNTMHPWYSYGRMVFHKYHDINISMVILNWNTQRDWLDGIWGMSCVSCVFMRIPFHPWNLMVSWNVMKCLKFHAFFMHRVWVPSFSMRCHGFHENSNAFQQIPHVVCVEHAVPWMCTWIVRSFQDA